MKNPRLAPLSTSSSSCRPLFVLHLYQNGLHRRTVKFNCFSRIHSQVRLGIQEKHNHCASSPNRLYRDTSIFYITSNFPCLLVENFPFHGNYFVSVNAKVRNPFVTFHSFSEKSEKVPHLLTKASERGDIFPTKYLIRIQFRIKFKVNK